MSEDKWLLDAMQKINDLTPDIKGKAFDPDWFLLREHLEKPVAELAALRAALAELVAVDNLWCTAKAAGTHERERSNLFAEYASRKPLAIATARALATKEPQP